MKHYPSIPHLNESMYGRRAIAFDKLDGSNLRYEWSKKRGWYKFGTRSVMIDEKHEQFGAAVPLFINKYGDDLAKIFVDDKRFRGIKNFIVYCEYLGENSSFGQHDPNDKMDVVLFDVNPMTKGFIGPKDFIKLFGHLHIPRVVFDGILDEDFVQTIKNNTELKEGVLCKGLLEKGHIWMTKVKTQKWLDELRRTKGEQALIEELK